MLKLSNVTIVAVETRAHELLRISLTDTLTKIDPAAVIIHTNDRTKFKIPGATYVAVPDWPSMEDVWKYTYFEAFKPIKTDFALFVEWDSGVVRRELWRDEFLNYDYIGAPWWWTDGKNVGNGGFAIRSHRLHDYLEKVKCAWTDNMICRDFRPQFEKDGFTWAPDDVAHAFAHEHPIGGGRESFGYHDSRNWDVLLSRDEIVKRVRIMTQNLANGPHYNFRTLMQQMPWLGNMLQLEGYASSWKTAL